MNTPQRALPPPMTVGRYVRENFKSTVYKYIAWASLSVPVSGAMRLRESEFAWWKLSLLPIARAMACLLACLVVAFALAISGWWKLHTKISPYVPVTIALIATIAVPAYRVS